jgi:hypothetical protein
MRAGLQTCLLNLVIPGAPQREAVRRRPGI